jgi:hypothetical protein
VRVRPGGVLQSGQLLEVVEVVHNAGKRPFQLRGWVDSCNATISI